MRLALCSSAVYVRVRRLPAAARMKLGRCRRRPLRAAVQPTWLLISPGPGLPCIYQLCWRCNAATAMDAAIVTFACVPRIDSVVLLALLKVRRGQHLVTSKNRLGECEAWTRTSGTRDVRDGIWGSSSGGGGGGRDGLCRVCLSVGRGRRPCFETNPIPSLPFTHFPSSNERLGLACNHASAQSAARDNELLAVVLSVE